MRKDISQRSIVSELVVHSAQLDQRACRVKSISRGLVPTRWLATHDPVKAEVFKLRFFAGLTMAQVALTLNISLATEELSNADPDNT